MYGQFTGFVWSIQASWDYVSQKSLPCLVPGWGRSHGNLCEIWKAEMKR